MAEYIDREAAMKRLKELHFGCKDFHLCGGVLLELNAIEAIPAFDVKPVVHGMWLSKEYMYGDPSTGTSDMWVERAAEDSDYCAYCSVCGKYAPYSSEANLILSDYCPNCGADMRGESK